MNKSLLKLAAIASIAGAVVMNPVSMQSAEALTETQVLERLSGIPVFTITDDRGAPLLGSLPPQQANANNPSQLMLFFLSPDDADTMLKQIRSNNQEVGKKARVIVRSLNDAYQVIKKNEDKKVAFQIVPSKSSLDSARTILSSQGKPPDQLPNVPVFFATGGKDKDRGLLTVEQEGKQYVPFFFDQKDLQALVDRAKTQQPDVANNTKIQVTSLFQVLDSMLTKDNKPNPDAERFTFVPARAALQSALEQAGGQAKPQIQPSSRPAASPKPAPKKP